jgi:virginiamycin B lyase
MLLLTLGVLSGTPVLLAQPTITEYPLPAASSPRAITKGPDGNLWFTEVNKIGKITTSGVITEYAIPTANSGLAGITAGPDGNIWFTEPSGNKIGKISPDGVIVEYPLPAASSSPSSIIAGPDGNLWFIEATGIGKITNSGVLTEYPSGQMVPSESQLAAGRDGNVWFTGLASGQIGRITPSGAITEFPLFTGLMLTPLGIIQGPDGNLWVTTTGTLWKFTAPGSAVPYYIPTPPSVITTGPDGNIWFPKLFNKIVKLTTNGAFTEYAAPNADGIVAGPDGNMWFTDPQGDKVGKLILSTVPPDNLLNLSQTSLTFSGPHNGSPPESQTLSVTSTTTASFTAAASS